MLYIRGKLVGGGMTLRVCVLYTSSSPSPHSTKLACNTKRELCTFPPFPQSLSVGQTYVCGYFALTLCSPESVSPINRPANTPRSTWSTQQQQYVILLVKRGQSMLSCKIPVTNQDRETKSTNQSYFISYPRLRFDGLFMR